MFMPMKKIISAKIVINIDGNHEFAIIKVNGG